MDDTQLDGYSLVAKMRKIRKKNPLTPTEQALYHELVSICNEEEWAVVFTCSNYDLCSPLQISENSLDKARFRLIQVGLIHYRSGKSRRQYGQYSFIKTLTTSQTTSKFETDSYTDKGVDSYTDKGVDSYTDKGVDSYTKPADNTKHINKQTKTQTKKSKSHSAASAAVPEKGLEYWKILVNDWFVFYQKNYSQKPTFNKVAAASLKSIVERIKKMSLDKNFEWTEDYARRCLLHFLTKAYSDEWLRANFLLNNLSTKFDSIVNESVNGTAKKEQQKSTGGNVDTDSILSKINGMPD